MSHVKLEPEDQGRGELLYQEGWAAKQRFRDYSYLILSLTGFLGGIFITYAFLFEGSEDVKTESICIFSIIPLMMIFLGILSMVHFAQPMPFRIYNNGLTMPYAENLKAGLKRIERFVSWDRVIRIKLGSTYYDDPATAGKAFIVEYDTSKKFEIYYLQYDNPFKIMALFERCVPKKLDKSITRFLKPVEEQEYRRSPAMGKKDSYEWALPMFLLVIFLLPIGAMLGDTVEKNHTFDLVAAVIGLTFINGFCLGLSVRLEKDDQKTMISLSARPSKDGVKIPTSSFGRLIKKYRPLIKWSEIARVEMSLSKVNFYHSATMVLVDSTRHECPYKALMFAARHPHFKQDGYDYVNTRIGNSVERLYRYRPYGILKLFGIVAFIFLLGFGIGYL